MTNSCERIHTKGCEKYERDAKGFPAKGSRKDAKGCEIKQQMAQKYYN